MIGKTIGIFDVAKLEWIMKPQSVIHLLRLNYSSKKKLDVDKTEERPNANRYFLAEDGKKE
jgi:hypothetical protein